MEGVLLEFSWAGKGDGRDARHLTMLSGWFGIMRNYFSVPDQVRHHLVLESFPHCGLSVRMTNRKFHVRQQCNPEKLGKSGPRGEEHKFLGKGRPHSRNRSVHLSIVYITYLFHRKIFWNKKFLIYLPVKVIKEKHNFIVTISRSAMTFCVYAGLALCLWTKHNVKQWFFPSFYIRINLHSLWMTHVKKLKKQTAVFATFYFTLCWGSSFSTLFLM